MKYSNAWDIPLSKKDVSGAPFERHISHAIAHIVYIVLMPLMKFLFRFKVEGRQHIQALQGKSGAVIVAPHVSYLDPVALWLSLRPHQFIRFMAKDTLFASDKGFFKRILGSLISRVGAFPIKRDSADKVAIKRAVAMLKRGELVGLFPEGTRRNKGDLEPELHGGAMLIARMGAVPVVAAGIRGVDKVKQPGKRLHFPKIEVVYSAPISISEFDFLPKEDRLLGAMWYIMRKSHALSRGVADHEVDMQALFPTARDFSAEFQDVAVGTNEFGENTKETKEV